jgi:hypothetical protein
MGNEEKDQFNSAHDGLEEITDDQFTGCMM